MRSTTPDNGKYDFIPIESIIAFAFIGFVFLVGLIARCLALNHSTIRNAQSLDLVIYQLPPKPNQAQRARRSSIEQQYDSANDSREQKTSYEDSETPARVQRGPKNL